jgi:hypothetical protein
MEDAAFNPLSGLCTVSSSWASYSGFRKACQFSRRAQTSWSGVADSRAGARAPREGTTLVQDLPVVSTGVGEFAPTLVLAVSDGLVRLLGAGQVPASNLFISAAG